MKRRKNFRKKPKDERKGLLNISAPMGASYEDILLCERMLNHIHTGYTYVMVTYRI